MWLFAEAALLPLLVFAVAVGFAIAETFWPLTVGVIIAAAAGVVAYFWGANLDSITPYLRWEFGVVYAIIGLGWLFFRWMKFVEKSLKDQKRSNEEAKRRGREQEPLKVPEWKNSSDGFSAYFFYWPFDVVAFVFSDLIEDIWKGISAAVGKGFDNYAQWRFRGL